VESVADKPAQLLHRPKLFTQPAIGGFGLESVELVLRVAVGFDVGSGEKVILVRGEDQDFTESTSGLALDGPVELHLGD
jgi:hypothetical protein